MSTVGVDTARIFASLPYVVVRERATVIIDGSAILSSSSRMTQGAVYAALARLHHAA